MLFFIQRINVGNAQSERVEKVEINPESVRKIEEKIIRYPDPWNTKNAGFPGIEIFIDDRDDPLILYFAYGMDRRRDQMFSLLTRWLDGLTASDPSDFEYYEDEDLQD
jgi:hypothetical protein